MRQKVMEGDRGLVLGDVLEIEPDRIGHFQPPLLLELEAGGSRELLGDGSDVGDRTRRPADAVPTVGQAIALGEERRVTPGDKDNACKTELFQASQVLTRFGD